MSHFKSYLESYLRGELNFAALAEHLSVVVTRDPDATSSTRQVIRAAENHGLPEPVSRALQSLLPTGSGRWPGNLAGDPGNFPRPDTAYGGSVPKRDAPSKRSSGDKESQDEPTHFDVDAAARYGRDGVTRPGSGNTTSGTRDNTDHQPDTAPTTEHLARGLPQLWSEVRSSRSRFLFAQREANQPTETGLDKRSASSEPKLPIGPGFVLKDRFELQQPLGEGGMGVVYRAVDRLKVEAGDKNPYLAIKLLASDLRSQRGGFIALQREASKAQRLAHPNIATVYDFDRDGDTIFMTMELLEGQPLSRLIRSCRPAGLPAAKAMRIIEQLGSALAYAHKHQLVHSDLKPGNCFLTEDERVKLLDFGIARASKTHTDAEGDSTLFDPGDLGALTPAYASVEMFDAEPPDPRDDIYALACICYELMAGRHPFDRVAAPRAKAKNLKPKRTSGLSRRQFQGLRRALAFERRNRTATVEQFLEEIAPGRARPVHMAAAGLIGLVLIGAIAYQPVVNHLTGKRNQHLIATITEGAEPEVLAAIASLDTLAPHSRTAVLDASRDTIIGLHERRARRAFDTGQERYDYPTAQNEVQAAKRLFPDSARVLLMSSALQQSRDELVASLEARYGRYSDEGRLLPVEGQEDIIDVMHVLRQVAPEHPLLSSRRLPLRYAQEVEKAMADGDLSRAAELVRIGAANTSGSPSLDSLRDRLAKRLTGSGP